MKVLLATDGSEYSDAAVDEIANRPFPEGTEVLVLSVWNWAAFDGHRATSHQKVFDELRNAIAAMGDEPVEAHADAKASRDPVQDHRAEKRAPAPEKRRGYGSPYAR